MRDLIGTPLKLAPDDKTLPICWRGPFKALGQVTEYFKPLALSFTNRRNSVRLVVPPEAYLVISGRKNVCLGILNGSEAEVGENNIIGEIFMQDKMVIYDNEKQRIGWKPEDCNTLLSLNHFIWAKQKHKVKAKMASAIKLQLMHYFCLAEDTQRVHFSVF